MTSSHKTSPPLLLALTLGALLTSQPGLANKWNAYGGGPGGGQYSDLKQINRDNIDDLEQAWEFKTGDFSYGDAKADATTFEANPIFANDTVYLCSPLGRTFALEPDTGKPRWTFDADIKKAGTALGLHVCRGVSYWEDDLVKNKGFCDKRVFMTTMDGRILAIDADTGKSCPDFGKDGQVQINDYDYVNDGPDVALSSPAAHYKDNLIVGGVVSSYSKAVAPNGIVRAFNARTGEETWNWNPLPEQMRKIMGGANVWPPMSVDEERGLVYLPTGSATVDPFGGHRKDNIPYANAVVALDGDTGEPVWNYQIVHHDLWDYDMPAQPIAVDIRQNGKRVPAVIQNTKMGLVFVFNRETGEPLFPIEERPVPQSDIPGEQSSPTQPFPTMPKPLTRLGLKAEDAWGVFFWDEGKCVDKMKPYRSEGLYTPPSLEGSVTLPSGYGGANWGNATYHPEENLLVVATTQIANVATLIPREQAGKIDINDHSNLNVGGPLEGTPYLYLSAPILSPFGSPCTPPPWGKLTAIDMDSGEVTWSIPFGAVPVPWAPFITTPEFWGSPLIGGPIATAGGLIFAGASLDKTFRAVDLKSGEVVWRNDLPAPGNATPMTYMYKGKQYVVIAAGGNAVAGTELGDAVVAFALAD